MYNHNNPKALRSETTLMPWLFWALAVLFYAYEFLQRVSISVFTPNLIQDLHTNATSIGIMSGFYYYAYASMQIPAGVLIDWFGPKKLATVGCALVTLGAFLFSMMHSIAVGSLARFIIGFGSAFAFVSAMQLVIIWFPPYRFALLAGLTNLAGYLGATLGEVPLTNATHAFGWRYTILGSAIIGVILTILIGIIVKDKPIWRFKKKSKNKPHKKKAPAIFSGLKHIFSSWRNWLNGLYAGLMVGPTSAFAALWGVGFFIKSDHLQPRIAASILSLLFIGVAAGSPVIGWLSDHFRKRQIILVIAAFGSLITSLLIIYINNLSLIALYPIAFLFGFFQSAHVLNFAIAKDLSSKKNSGTAMGFTNMMVMIGGAILQPFIGVLLDWARHGATLHGNPLYTTVDYHFALVVIPACQFIAVIIAIFGLKDPA